MGGERVEEGVGGRVVGLAGRAEHPARPTAQSSTTRGEVQPSVEGVEQCLGFGPVPAQQRHRYGGVPAGCQAGADGGGERAIGADLHEPGGSGGLQAPYAVVEADGPAYVAYPVGRVAQLLGRGGLPGHVGDERDGGRRVGEAAGHFRELLQHRVHVAGVEGVRDPQPLGSAPLGVEVRGDGQHRLRVARDDHRGGPVDGGQVHAVVQQGAYLLLRRVDGGHRSALGQRLHAPAARGDEGAGVLERQHSGDVGGDQFADGVAEQQTGGDAPGSDQPEQRDLDREQCGLGPSRPVEELRLVEDHVAQRAARASAVEDGADLVQRPGEHREAAVQFAAHTGPLGSLSGEQEGGLSVPHGSEVRAGRGVAVREGAEGAGGRFRVLGEDDRALLERRTGRGEREPEVERARAAVGHRGQSRGLCAQRGRGQTGEGQRHGEAGGP
ncbi:hypothetical protein SBADM41S_05643 [Streptomyces badius]